MRSVAALAVTAALVGPAQAQTEGGASQNPSEEPRGVNIGKFLGGAAVGLALHEGSHLFVDVLFDADPRLRRVEFGGLPFFAITHRAGLSPRREFTILSAGFWAQHGASEAMLSRRPTLRDERAPFAKGLLAFNVLASVAYAGAAFAHAGPFERDTRGMAEFLGVDERWVGALILAPAIMDGFRYFHPEARRAAWIARGLKVGFVLLVLK